MILLRRLLGDVLRRQRQRQGRTLREVSSSARVSLGYLSEVERGQKEASSELLSAICDALDVRMSQVMREVSDELSLAELAESATASEKVPAPMRPMLNSVSVTSVTGVPDERVTIKPPKEAVDVVAACRPPRQRGSSSSPGR
jgi:transcriptional regulator with XRE-family HTH domain